MVGKIDWPRPKLQSGKWSTRSSDDAEKDTSTNYFHLSDIEPSCKVYKIISKLYLRPSAITSRKLYNVYTLFLPQITKFSKKRILSIFFTFHFSRVLWGKGSCRALFLLQCPWYKGIVPISSFWIFFFDVGGYLFWTS
jgi:hypothetical protein